MDYIKMKKMRFFSHVGCLEEEKINGQEFVISIDLGFKTPIPGCKTDNLEDTSDYSVIYSEVRDLVTSASDNLIERLAQKIADKVFEIDKKVDKVVVTVEKPNAPIDGLFASMDVVIERDRDDND
ncbi:MAG: dihydroneopterin aldolase [Clostridia bacterium]|nr:dihydroneopterin aldolase [Clostridia bacterium]